MASVKIKQQLLRNEGINVFKKVLDTAIYSNLSNTVLFASKLAILLLNAVKLYIVSRYYCMFRILWEKLTD